MINKFGLNLNDYKDIKVGYIVEFICSMNYMCQGEAVEILLDDSGDVLNIKVSCGDDATYEAYCMLQRDDEAFDISDIKEITHWFDPNEL
jgi:hypothetical protein